MYVKTFVFVVSIFCLAGCGKPNGEARKHQKGRGAVLAEALTERHGSREIPGPVWVLASQAGVKEWAEFQAGWGKRLPELVVAEDEAPYMLPGDLVTRWDVPALAAEVKTRQAGYMVVLGFSDVVTMKKLRAAKFPVPVCLTIEWNDGCRGLFKAGVPDLACIYGMPEGMEETITNYVFRAEKDYVIATRRE